MRWSRLGSDPALDLRRLVSRPHVRTARARRDSGSACGPAAVGASEPLDCDEAAYAYIGHRILRGDVMYRDLTENKPPLGYWLYTLAVALGGYSELAIRVHADSVRPGDDRAGVVDRAAPGRPGIGVPGRRALHRPQHGPLPLRQRRQPRAFHQFLRGRIARALDSWVGPHGPMVSRGFGRLPGGRYARQAGRASSPSSSSSRPSSWRAWTRESTMATTESCAACSTSLHSGWAWCRSWRSPRRS